MMRPYDSNSRSKNLEFLVRVYIGGIIFAVLVVIVPVFLSAVIPSSFILTLGVLHLLALIFLGLQLNDVPAHYRSSELMEAAERIQSAGYLHTLIGFLYAISNLGRVGFDMSSLAIPLSSALITSILGWLVGGEFAAKGKSESPDVERATRKVVTALEDYSRRLTEIQSNYIQKLESEYTQRVNGMVNFQRTLTKKLETDYENRVQGMLAIQESHINMLEDAHKQHAAEILKFYESSNEELITIHQELNKTSTAMTGSLDIFSRTLNVEQSKIKTSLQNFCYVIDQQNQNFQSSLQPYKAASAEIGESSRVLSESMRSLGANGTKAAQEVSVILKSMGTASAHVQDWSRKAGASVGEVNRLLVELQKNQALSRTSGDES